MLSPDYLKGCADDIVAFYQALEDEIIKDIVRRLINTDFEITQSAVWQAEKLQQAGMVYDEVVRRVAEASGKPESMIRDLFEEGGTETLAYDDAIYRRAGLHPLPIKQSQGMLNTLIAGAKKRAGTVKNQTMTTAATSQSACISACDFAYIKVTSGAFDINTAVRQAVKSIADSGTSVLYPSGHTDKIDVAVRRATTTGVSQTCGQLQLDRADEMDCDLVETTAHMGARLSHSYWQGRVFSRGGNSRYPDFVESTGYGTGAGLMGWNCRHGFFPYFEGLSKRAYTDKELNDYERHTVTYNGKSYTDYDASQVQRGMERSIRATKRELNAFDTCIKEGKTAFRQDYADAAVKLKRQEQRLKDFLEQTGRAEEKSRVLVEGFGRSEARKAAAAGKNVLKVKNKTDIIKLPKDIIEVSDVHKIGKIDISKFKIISNKILTDEVIITNDRINHIIKRRGEEFYNLYSSFFPDIVRDPDYIFPDKNPNTAIISKRLRSDDKTINIVLRIVVEGDNPSYKNSIITAIGENEKRFQQRLRNNKTIFEK